ncbi:Na+/H+ antiporter NhaC [Bacilliculturomica massiliensis]|uniref:Na+/H+ antiporter NhaC n=1 Tax=Bacilliculturomica massiliensis TaxID=1917867 RepID=UPI0010320EF3|nr:Na+/H+ antiporter NhaC [Bacilliculturomica massiliensis]
MAKKTSEPPFIESLLLMALSLALLMYNIFILGGDAHIPLIAATTVISVYAIIRLGFRWDDLMDSIRNGIQEIATTILIFGIIGMMIAAWIMGGIVPTLIYYGLKILNPQFFLVMTMIVSAIVSMATGSSWTAVGTMGVVFLGIGAGFGVPMPVTAGAAISGAYFGDKISPLSDTTNLAPAVSGATLFDHIRHMLVSSGISFVISGIIFLFMGMKYGGGSGDLRIVAEIGETIASSFYISPVLLIVPCVVIAMGALKMPAVPSLFLGVVLGAVCCSLFQKYDLGAISTALNYGFTFECENEMLSSLLSGGGIQKMMWSMSLTLCAICFGSVLDTTQILHVLASKVLSITKGVRGLITCTVLTCLATNIITGDQYLGIILPGKMYRKNYEEQGLAPQNLSRALEDSATVTSPIVPWSSCAAVMVAALGIPAVEYMPYCFFSFISPLVSIFLGITGISITRLEKPDEPEK